MQKEPEDSSDQFKYDQELKTPPEKPSIRGLRYVYFHALRDIYKIYNDRLNPDSENYPFKNYKEYAADPRILRRSLKTLYEKLYEDYENVLPKLEENEDYELSPSERIVVDLHERITSQVWMMEYAFQKMLDLAHLKATQRRVKGWFNYYDYEMGNLFSWINSSAQAKSVLMEIIDPTFATQENLHLALEDLVRDILNLVNSEDPWKKEREAYSRIDHIANKYYRLEYTLNLFARKIEGSIEYADNLVSSKSSPKTFEELFEIAKNLGQGLKSTLEGIKVFESTYQYGRAGLPGEFNRWPINGIRLSYPFFDLSEVYGDQVRIHTSGRTLYEDRVNGPQFGIRVYSASIITQYVFAVGALVNQLGRTKEGRGDLKERLQEGIKRLASGLHLSKNQEITPSEMIDDSRSAASSLLLSASLQKEETLPTTTVQKRADLESKLWDVFFEHAELASSSSDKSSCPSALMALTPIRD